MRLDKDAVEEHLCQTVNNFVKQNKLSLLSLLRKRRPPQGGSKRHSLQAAELSRLSCHSGLKLLCKSCRTSPPQQWGPDLRFLGMPAMRTRWLTGAAAPKSGDVETNPGTTTLYKKVWICDICRKHFLGRQQPQWWWCSFYYISPVIRNNLPDSVVESDTINTFMKRLDNHRKDHPLRYDFSQPHQTCALSDQDVELEPQAE